VVSPIVDYCETVPEIDASRLGLIGLSFGGYLAPRAAALEPRIRAVVAIDGIFDAHESATSILTPKLAALFDEQRADAFNAAARATMAGDGALRWYIEHGMWCFRASTPYDFLDRTRPYTLQRHRRTDHVPRSGMCRDGRPLQSGSGREAGRGVGRLRNAPDLYRRGVRQRSCASRRLGADEQRGAGLVGRNPEWRAAA
jgi:pimeloyl-ACP methyl ester carboxylesterase